MIRKEDDKLQSISPNKVEELEVEERVLSENSALELGYDGKRMSYSTQIANDTASQ
jgi:hypothetical protein